MPETRERSALEVLRSVEWSGCPENDWASCPECGGLRPTHFAPAGTYACDGRVGHYPDCALDAVLSSTPASDGGEVRERVVEEIERGILAALDEAREGDSAPTLRIAQSVGWRLDSMGLLRTPQGEGEDEWEPMSMAMAGVAHPRLIPFRHRLSGVVAWVDQRAAARLRGEGGGG